MMMMMITNKWWSGQDNVDHANAYIYIIIHLQHYAYREGKSEDDDNGHTQLCLVNNSWNN